MLEIRQCSASATALCVPATEHCPAQPRVQDAEDAALAGKLVKEAPDCEF